MPRFYFNAQTGNETVHDPVGEELADESAARRCALRDAQDSIIEAVKFSSRPPDFIRVTDSDGAEVMSVSIVDTLLKRSG